MPKKKIIYLCIAVATFIFFISVMPEYIVVSAEFFWAILAAVIVGIFIYLGLKPDEAEMYTPENYEREKARSGIAILITIFVGIVTIFAVYFINASRIETYIKANSLVTDGTIYDGQSTTTKSRGSSSTTYQVDVRFLAGGIPYSNSVSISSSNWDKVGKGMGVLVAYAKEHPNMCRILFNLEDVKKYTTNVKINPVAFNDLFALRKSKKFNLLEELNKISLGWSAEQTDRGVDLYSNCVLNCAINKTDNILFLLETEKDGSFTSLLNDARKNMKVVYDSMGSNTRVGALFQKDSLQIRFQNYSARSRETTKTEYGEFPNFSLTHFYIVAVGGKNDLMILPGDLKDDEEELLEKLLKERVGVN